MSRPAATLSLAASCLMLQGCAWFDSWLPFAYSRTPLARAASRHGAMRTDVVRAGAAKNVEAFVDELCRASPEFASMWRDNDVRTHGDGVKTLRHAVVGPIAMEYSAFAVDGRPDLGLVIYNPATPDDVDKVKSLLKARRRTAV